MSYFITTFKNYINVITIKYYFKISYSLVWHPWCVSWNNIICSSQYFFFSVLYYLSCLNYFKYIDFNSIISYIISYLDINFNTKYIYKYVFRFILLSFVSQLISPAVFKVNIWFLYEIWQGTYKMSSTITGKNLRFLHPTFNYIYWPLWHKYVRVLIYWSSINRETEMFLMQLVIARIYMLQIYVYTINTTSFE